MNKKQLAKRRKIEKDIDDLYTQIYESVEHLVKLRERFLNLGLTLNDSLATNNLEYRKLLREIMDAKLQTEDLEHELSNFALV